MIIQGHPYRKSQRIVELKFGQLELDLLESYRGCAKQAEVIKQLHEKTGISDRSLMERLYQAGFTADTIEVLTWLPVALVAWASDGVTPDEKVAASVSESASTSVQDNQQMRLYASWFEERPREDLAKLWEDYTIASRQVCDRDQHVAMGHDVLKVATNVARASGGFIGFGSISAAEQRVLDRIRHVYGLGDESP